MNPTGAHINSVVRSALASPRKRAKLQAIMRIFPRVSPSDRCVDIGTGTGVMAHCFANHGSWTFVDVNATELETAKRFVSGEFVAGDADDFFSKHHSPELGLVCCFDTLMYFQNPAETAARIAKSLRIGGEVVFSGTEHQRSGDPLIWIREKLGIERALGFRHHIAAVEMQALLAQNGLSEVETRFFCGFFTCLLQTAIDYIIIRSSAGNDLGGANAADFAEKKGGRFALTVFSALSTFTAAIDWLFFFLPRYGYVIRARKGTGPRS